MSNHITRVHKKIPQRLLSDSDTKIKTKMDVQAATAHEAYSDFGTEKEASQNHLALMRRALIHFRRITDNLYCCIFCGTNVIKMWLVNHLKKRHYKEITLQLDKDDADDKAKRRGNLQTKKDVTEHHHLDETRVVTRNTLSSNYRTISDNLYCCNLCGTNVIKMWLVNHLKKRHPRQIALHCENNTDDSTAVEQKCGAVAPQNHLDDESQQLLIRKAIFHFRKVSDNLYRCNICGIKVTKKWTANHLKKRHRKEIDFVNENAAGKINARSAKKCRMGSVTSQHDDENLDDLLITKALLNFQKVSHNLYRCNICGIKVIKMWLTNHLKKRHSKQIGNVKVNVMHSNIKTRRRGMEFIFAYFSTVAENRYQCNTCGSQGGKEFMRKHLKRKHVEEYSTFLQNIEDSIGGKVVVMKKTVEDNSNAVSINNSSSSSSSSSQLEDGICVLCQTADNNAELGVLHQGHGLTAHFHCLLFSSALPQASVWEEHIASHLAGFEPAAIRKEVYRGRKLRCTHCRKTGATLGCNLKSCTQMFHLPCALAAGAVPLYEDTFPIFCRKHRPRQSNLLTLWKKSLAEVEDGALCCAVCLDEVQESELENDLLHGTCCSSSWLHLKCAKLMGASAGRYHVRCPLCGDSNVFSATLLSLGVDLPQRDAAWECEEKAFEELYERPSVCVAQQHCPNGCACPEGALFDDDEEGTDWELLVCSICGAVASHRACASQVGHLLADGHLVGHFMCFECQEMQQGEREVDNNQQHESITL